MTKKTDSSETSPSFDLKRFTRWYIAQGFSPFSGELHAKLITGGKSNLTYRVYDDKSSWVLRRPPLGHVQDTAHDMRREFLVMSRLASTRVPVPSMFALCKDPSVLGFGFFVMEDVEGVAYRHADQLRSLGPTATTRIADSMIDVLANLHAIDPADVGLASFGRPAGFLRRQVLRWGRQLDSSRSRELPDAERLLGELISRTDVHPDGEVSIVHGDYRLDNLLVYNEAVNAVIDWEMSTLGDPLTDLALLFVYHNLNQISGADGVATASMAPGYPDLNHQLVRYMKVSGRQIDDMSLHLGLAHLKLAVILEGIYYRHRRGQTVGEGFAEVGESVRPLLAAGLSALNQSSLEV